MKSPSTSEGDDLTPPIRPFGNTIWTKGWVMSESKHMEAQMITPLKQVGAGRTAWSMD